MTALDQMNAEQLQQLRRELKTRIDTFAEAGLSLDMTRGKPSAQQLDLAERLLALPGEGNHTSAGGTDCRNYGGLEGLPESRGLFAEILEVPAEQVMVQGNSSLTLMHDCLVRALLFGVPGGEGPWSAQEKLKFLCPSPGYDRHFTLTEHLDFDLIGVTMTRNGPDMDEVESLVRDDAAIKGIWCVPRYQNPTGAIFSAETVNRLAKMDCAAPDFRIMWDDAYAVHFLGDAPASVENILSACTAAGHGDRVMLFASTSKISFAGAGLAALAGSAENIRDARSHMSYQLIGPDKINQLRHAMMFPDKHSLLAHMRAHAELLRPKFDKVQEVLEAELGPASMASWTRPTGGYFVSLDTADGCARAVIDLASDLGVKLTPAGATFPNGKDPRDRNIRIAPSFPTVDDIEKAMEILAVAIKFVSVEKLLEKF